MKPIPPTPVYFQNTIYLKQAGRGCHYITDQVVHGMPEISKIKVGMCNIFLKHTSASITLNENYDSDVLLDMETGLNRIAKEGDGLYIHTSEGPDDMPAHIKCSVIGASIDVPITNGKLNLGTWQGIWLCEHRSSKQSREIVITVHGMQI